jgi:hypothetical protein
MKPESAAFLRKALEFLKKADGMLNDWPDEPAGPPTSRVCTARKR